MIHSAKEAGSNEAIDRPGPNDDHPHPLESHFLPHCDCKGLQRYLADHVWLEKGRELDAFTADHYESSSRYNQIPDKSTEQVLVR